MKYFESLRMEIIRRSDRFEITAGEEPDGWIWMR